MAYHFSASLPRTPAHSVLPSRSRLSAPDARMGQSAERPGLLEFLHELAFEKSLCVDRRAYRIGLAATPWQLQQSLSLLRQQSVPSPLSQKGPYSVADATQDRVVALVMNTSLNTPFTGALATIWLRRDGACGLPQDQSPANRQALEPLRQAGKRLVAVEALAFDPQVPFNLVLDPFLQALNTIVINTWDATDIVTSCPRAHVPYYCNRLGFTRVAGQGHAQATSMLLRMSTQRKVLAPQAETMSA